MDFIYPNPLVTRKAFADELKKEVSEIYKIPSVISNCDTSLVTRKAFADELKKEVSEIYKIPSDIHNCDKDKKIFIHYKNGTSVSARDLYIEWANIRLEQDPDYWSDKVLKNIDPDRLNIITDWRFHHELNYISKYDLNIMTARVYRSEVAEPDSSITSEHDLDNYTTDILFVRDEQEFEIAKKRFPQYSDYKYISDI